MKNFRNVAIILCSNPETLSTELKRIDSGTAATVEAEYGDTLVEGDFSLAHHGPRSYHRAPCVCPNAEGEEGHRYYGALGMDVLKDLVIVGLSHVDLDSLGGVLALMNRKPEAPAFWDAAGAVDVNGAHKLQTPMKVNWSDFPIEVDEKTQLQLHSFWAWSEANRLFPPRDGSVTSANKWCTAAEAQIQKILDGDAEALEAGRAHAAASKALNESSFTQTVGPVVIRTSESFVNHIYSSPSGDLYMAVVGYNTKTKAVTVSLADPIEGVSCREIVQELWGPEAGGHDGIAGSPRDREMTYEDAVETAERLARAIASKELWHPRTDREEAYHRLLG